MADVTNGLAGHDESEDDNESFLVPEGEQEESDEAEELFWQIRESRGCRAVVHLGVVCEPERGVARSFFREGLHAECHRLSQAIVKYRNEEGETSQVVETWAPCDLIPPGTLAGFDYEGEIIEWLRENRSIEVRRIECRVGLKWPTPKDDALCLDTFNDQPILRTGRAYLDAEGRLVVWQWERSSHWCILGFDRDHVGDGHQGPVEVEWDS